jgi:hypothetical protein
MFRGSVAPVPGYHMAGDLLLPPGVLDLGGGSPVNPPFMVHWIGPRTAYNFCRRKAVVDAILLRFWKEGDRVMFVAGEVDCRHHLPKQANKQNKPVEELAKECMDRFFKFICGYKKYGLVIYFVVPTTIRGDGQQRASSECNKRLAELAAADKLPFISLYEEMCTIPKEWYCDGTHLDSRLALPLIIEKFKRLGLVQ